MDHDRPTYLSSGGSVRGAQTRMSGTMLWFNAEKDLGALRTAAGDRIEVPGSAFAPGERPAGRCAGAAIEFAALDRSVSGIVFVTELNPRRARRRSR